MIKKLLSGLILGLAVISINAVQASAEWKQNINNKWIYEENGQAVSGWKFIDGNWYNFANAGVMQTGWIKGDGSDWYYCWSNGTMARNSWLTNGGLWYYFDEQGKLVYDTAKVGSNTYYFNEPAMIISTKWGKEYNDEVSPSQVKVDSEESANDDIIEEKIIEADK